MFSFAQNMLPEGFWRSQFGTALAVTLILLALWGAGSILYAQRARLRGMIRGRPLLIAAQLFRAVMVLGAVGALLTLFFARQSVGMGSLMYMFLVPLLAVQLVVGCLSWWTRSVVRDPVGTSLLACIVGAVAFAADYTMFVLAGYTS